MDPAEPQVKGVRRFDVLIVILRVLPWWALFVLAFLVLNWDRIF